MLLAPLNAGIVNQFKMTQEGLGHASSLKQVSLLDLIGSWRISSIYNDLAVLNEGLLGTKVSVWGKI